MKKKTTSSDVAKWMLSEFEGDGYLQQSVALYGISEKFGDEFLTQKQDGSVGIAQSVLSAFRKLTDDDVVWSRSALAWRRREEYDQEGRMQP